MKPDAQVRKSSLTIVIRALHDLYTTGPKSTVTSDVSLSRGYKMILHLVWTEGALTEHEPVDAEAVAD